MIWSFNAERQLKYMFQYYTHHHIENDCRQEKDQIEYAIKLVWEEDKFPFPCLSLKSDPSKAHCNKIIS